MTEPTPDQPPIPGEPPTEPEPPEEPPAEEQPTEPTPEEPPAEGEPEPTPEFCTSQYPADPSITCELPYGHNPRMIHRRSTGIDQPYYEWE